MFIIVLAIIKYIIFVLTFIFTAGKLKFWIFPNLTEDVGFFESFWPVYVYTYDKPKKAKDSDDEESSDEESEEDEKGKEFLINPGPGHPFMPCLQLVGRRARYKMERLINLITFPSQVNCSILYY